MQELENTGYVGRDEDGKLCYYTTVPTIDQKKSLSVVTNLSEEVEILLKTGHRLYRRTAVKVNITALNEEGVGKSVTGLTLYKYPGDLQDLGVLPDSIENIDHLAKLLILDRSNYFPKIAVDVWDVSEVSPPVNYEVGESVVINGTPHKVISKS